MIPDPTKMRPEDQELDGLSEPDPVLATPDESKTSRSIGGFDMAIGIAVGVALGAAVGAVRDDLGMWVAIGIAIGVFGGFLVSQVRRSRV